MGDEGQAVATVGFVEFSSSDPDRTRKFLERAFGWRFTEQALPLGTYLSFGTPDGRAGGIRPTQSTETPATISYVRVTDLDRALETVRRAGGEVVLPRVDVPAMGSFFWFKVPGGPILACWQDWAGGTPNREVPR